MKKYIAHLKEVIYDYGNIVVALKGYTAEILEGEITLTDHDMYKWVTLSEINDYKLAPADIPLVEYLLAKDI